LIHKDKLNNGAVILRRAEKEKGYWVVLAQWNQGLHPFVTWAADENGDAYWGHYFKSYDEALADWKERI